jgi:hypothetical protein
MFSAPPLREGRTRRLHEEEVVRRYQQGDKVTARRMIADMNVPEVPAGSVGTVVATTVLGKPKKVHFALKTVWGPKQFHVDVRRGDVD